MSDQPYVLSWERLTGEEKGRADTWAFSIPFYAPSRLFYVVAASKLYALYKGELVLIPEADGAGD